VARSKRKQIRANVKYHDVSGSNYENKHSDEIFNKIEQSRLVGKLSWALSCVNSGSKGVYALDYGCGSGNVARHLLGQGVRTVAADVSDGCLTHVREKLSHLGQLETMLLNGQDLSNVPDEAYDFISTYSVLHHVPDYLAIIGEMARCLKPGGVLYIDHEASETYWNQTHEYKELVRRVNHLRRQGWGKFFRPSNYLKRARSLAKRARRKFMPTYVSEAGDIHVTAKDHIEWDKIQEILDDNLFQTLVQEDYLLYRQKYPIELWAAYKDNATDMTLLIAKKTISTTQQSENY